MVQSVREAYFHIEFAHQRTQVHDSEGEVYFLKPGL